MVVCLIKKIKFVMNRHRLMSKKLRADVRMQKESAKCYDKDTCKKIKTLNEIKMFCLSRGQKGPPSKKNKRISASEAAQWARRREGHMVQFTPPLQIQDSW